MKDAPFFKQTNHSRLGQRTPSKSAESPLAGQTGAIHLSQSSGTGVSPVCFAAHGRDARATIARLELSMGGGM